MNWPGRGSYEMRNKVDTAFDYVAGTQHVRSWGFECDEDDVTEDVEKRYKLLLDPSFIDTSGFAPTHVQARQCYRDFLAELYQCITQFLRDRVAHFEAKRIELVFATLTTSKSPAMIANIERLIRATGQDLQALFDEQIERIYDLLDDQLRAVQSSHPEELVSYLVLSGGFGNSPYLQKRIRERYERGAGSGSPNARNMTILLASDPVLCRELYDEVKHQGEDVEQDPYTKKRFAETQVSWFVKRGNMVDVKQGINQRFRNKIALGRERDPWRTAIVSSSLPTNQLPQSLRHEGVKQVCTIETVLDTHDMKRKNNKWYHLRREYNEAEFDVKLLIGTGLQFEVWCQDGKKRKSHDEIEVEWEVPDDADIDLTKGRHDGLGIYRVS
ncbi:hypothetical protein LTR17_008596 [Elasticomyces elasticus]|nr:hypothetical protein LTR17_008596 [Elasticomyces elasticus]